MALVATTRTPAFEATFQKCREGLAWLFQTKQESDLARRLIKAVSWLRQEVLSL
jgi:hypothetical protein